MSRHVASLTRENIDAAHRAALYTDHPISLIVDDTHQRAVVLPSGRVTVRADRCDDR